MLPQDTVIKLYRVLPRPEAKKIRTAGFRDDKALGWGVHEDGTTVLPFSGVVLYSMPYLGGRPVRRSQVPEGYTVLAVAVAEQDLADSAEIIEVEVEEYTHVRKYYTSAQYLNSRARVLQT